MKGKKKQKERKPTASLKVYKETLSKVKVFCAQKEMSIQDFASRVLEEKLSKAHLYE